jgi:hypothetical protein
LLDPDAVPYFLWDVGMTVSELRTALARPSSRSKDELIAKLLREGRVIQSI